MTLSCSRNATMRSCAVPSSSIFSPASRAGAASTFDDLLAGTGPADLVGGETEVGHLDLVDRLVLRRHDPLEGGVAGLDDTGSHAHDGRQRRLHDVVPGLGLALDRRLAVRDLDVLRERERRPAEELRDLRRDRAGVPVGRLGGGEHEVDAADPLDRLREHLRGGQRVAPGEGVVRDEDRLRGTHGERGAQARDLVVRRHRDERDLAATRGVGQLQGHLHAVAVGLVEDQLALPLEGLGSGVELARRGRVGDLLHADGDVHGSPVGKCRKLWRFWPPDAPDVETGRVASTP